MAKFFRERERRRKRRRRGMGNVELRVEGERKWSGRWRIQHVGLCCRNMCYLWVQRSLFAGQRGIDFLSMSVPLFRAQHGGDNSKLIHFWIRINIQAANINSQPKGGNAGCVKMLKQIRNKKSPRSLTKNSIPRLSYECIIFTGSYSRVSAFCLISVLIFIMIFYRRARAGGSWRAACCFWLFSSLSPGFQIWIWIFMI